MITSNDFRRGMVIKLDGNLYSVVEYQHVKPARGGAF
nr:elongation factor P [Spirochaetota bacterium]